MQAIFAPRRDPRPPRRMVPDRPNNGCNASDLAAPLPLRRGPVRAALLGWMAIVASIIILTVPAPSLAQSTGQNGGGGGNAPNEFTGGGGGGPGLAGDGSSTGGAGGGG